MFVLLFQICKSWKIIFWNVLDADDNSKRSQIFKYLAIRSIILRGRLSRGEISSALLSWGGELLVLKELEAPEMGLKCKKFRVSVLVFILVSVLI